MHPRKGKLLWEWVWWGGLFVMLKLRLPRMTSDYSRRNIDYPNTYY